MSNEDIIYRRDQEKVDAFLARLNNTNPSALYKETMESVDNQFSSNVIFILGSDPDISLFIKNWSLPDIDIGEINTGFDYSKETASEMVILPGDTMTYSDISLEIMCDEYLIIWEKIYRLMRKYAHNPIQYLFPASLIFFRNTKDSAYFRMFFYDMWFRNLSGMGGEASIPNELSFNVMLKVSLMQPDRDPWGI